MQNPKILFIPLKNGVQVKYFKEKLTILDTVIAQNVNQQEVSQKNGISKNELHEKPLSRCHLTNILSNDKCISIAIIPFYGLHNSACDKNYKNSDNHVREALLSDIVALALYRKHPIIGVDRANGRIFFPRLRWTRSTIWNK